MIFDQVYVFIESQGPLAVFVIMVVLALAAISLIEFLENLGKNRRN